MCMHYNTIHFLLGLNSLDVSLQKVHSDGFLIAVRVDALAVPLYHAALADSPVAHHYYLDGYLEVLLDHHSLPQTVYLLAVR